MKVIKDYKYIDDESENCETDFSKFKDNELEKAVFEFIAESQNAEKDLALKKEKLKVIRKLTAEQKLVENKIVDLKEKYEKMQNNFSDDTKSLEKVKKDISNQWRERMTTTVLDRGRLKSMSII